MILYNLITILGPTAVGKTRTATLLAHRLGSEVISADSRQVYKGMTIGTGKDLNDYVVNGQQVPYHLIDIREPGYEYNLFEYQRDFFNAFESIAAKGKTPVLCGGTGLYIAAAIHPEDYRLTEVQPNMTLRSELDKKSMDELKAMYVQYRSPHNVSDFSTKKRLIRAIEIQEAGKGKSNFNPPAINSLVIGIYIDVVARRQRITQRLNYRLQHGMIDEINTLLKTEKPEKLIWYGLEYKYITLYLTGKLSYDDMVHQLETAIHQFAKRQMTWFRSMERKGTTIYWIDAHLPEEEKIFQILKLLHSSK